MELEYYVDKLKEFVMYLRNFNNSRLTKLLDKKENLIYSSFNAGKIIELSKRLKNLLSISPADLHYTEHIYVEKDYYSLINDICFIISLDNSISKRKFLDYLYSNDIVLVLRGNLSTFLYSVYFDIAKEKVSFKVLKNLYDYQFADFEFKIRVAKSIVELLELEANVKEELLLEWKYLAMNKNDKLEYLKSLKDDSSLNCQEYIDLLFLYLELDADDKVKAYIYKVLFEDTIILSDRNADKKYIMKLLKK